LPVRNRLSDVALLFGEISQVLFDRRVVGLAAMRGVQVLLGLVQPPEPEVGPAERVLERSVAGIACNRFLEKVSRRLEMDAAVCRHVAQIILARGIVGLDGEQLLKGLFRAGGVAGSLEARTEAEKSFRAVRKLGDGLSRDARRSGIVLEPGIGAGAGGTTFQIPGGRGPIHRGLPR